MSRLPKEFVAQDKIGGIPHGSEAFIDPRFLVVDQNDNAHLDPDTPYKTSATPKISLRVKRERAGSGSTWTIFPSASNKDHHWRGRVLAKTVAYIEVEVSPEP